MVKNTLFPFLFTLFALCCSNRSIGQGQCDYYSVKFSNVTNKEIHLAVSYIPLEKEISSNSFESKAWYILQPGETKLIFNTKCLTFYYYADTPFDENGKRLEWKGGDKIYVDGKYFYFKKKDCRNFNARLEGKACVIVQGFQ